MSDLLKYSEIKKWDVDTLEAKLKELRLEIFEGQLKKKTVDAKAPNTLKVVKKNLARLLTLKNSRRKETLSK